MSLATRLFPLLALAICAAAQDCSTEKVNGDCTITIDRRYPVTPPTIQLRRGKAITVLVKNPLQFETLTLDPQSAQAVAGTDQTSGLLTALIPDAKNFVAQTKVVEAGNLLELSAGVSAVPLPQTPEELAKADIAILTSEIETAENFVPQAIAQIFPIYLQLQEILSPLPRPLTPVPGKDAPPPPFPVFGDTTTKQNPAKTDSKTETFTTLRPADFPKDTPNPWEDFPAWRALLVCELNGSGAKCERVGILNTLADANLPTTQNGKITWTQPQANGKSFDDFVTDTNTDIGKLPQDEQSGFKDQVTALKARESKLVTAAAFLSKIQQDLTSYAQNIQLVGTDKLADPQNLGVIYDPNCPPKTVSNPTANNSHCPKNLLLGAQSVFAVNAVNQIGTLSLSVPSSTQKKAIATITVIFADPIFEVSTGLFFSTLPNRSFSNITQITQMGTTPTPENVVIAQTIVRPTIVPYAAANWRLGHDFIWRDKRRGAFYLTAALGLNPNTTTTEFAFGPSVSWRSLMFCALVHVGHDVELTQGEFVGEVWCNQTAATSTTGKCSGSAPNPTTQKFWTPAFAVGIGVRVPTTFGGIGH